MGSYEAAISLTYVVITGPLEGVVYERYIFSAEVSPITTTLPLNYIWQATDQIAVTHTSGLSDPHILNWDMHGMKLITLTVTNPGGSVVDTSFVMIDDVTITGLEAYNDSPTLLGKSTTLSATIEEGTNFNYSWDFGY